MKKFYQLEQKLLCKTMIFIVFVGILGSSSIGDCVEIVDQVNKSVSQVNKNDTNTNITGSILELSSSTIHTDTTSTSDLTTNNIILNEMDIINNADNLTEVTSELTSSSDSTSDNNTISSTIDDVNSTTSSSVVGNESTNIPAWTSVVIAILLALAGTLSFIYCIRLYSLRRRKADRRRLLHSVSQEGFFVGGDFRYDNTL